MNSETDLYLQKADHAMLVASELFSAGHISDAASKIYYAMFYAAQALLKTEGIDVIKHSAVESALGYYFAKPQRIDPALHKMLIKARKLREIADYDIYEEIIEPVSTLTIDEGKLFISEIKKFLNK